MIDDAIRWGGERLNEIAHATRTAICFSLSPFFFWIPSFPYIHRSPSVLSFPAHSKCRKQKASSWQQISAQCSMKPVPRAAPVLKNYLSLSVSFFIVFVYSWSFFLETIFLYGERWWWTSCLKIPFWIRLTYFWTMLFLVLSSVSDLLSLLSLLYCSIGSTRKWA